MTRQGLHRLRFPLLGLGMLACIGGIGAGLVRLGWSVPLPAYLLMAHGPLMVCGFLGTLIGLERAVALAHAWFYVAPLLTGVGTLALVAGLPAPLLMTGGSLGLVVALVVMVRRQPGLVTGTMALGGLFWMLGNMLWLLGGPIFRVFPWWTAFLVLTIAGERLELSRVVRRSRGSQAAFLVALALLLAGVLVTLRFYGLGVRLVGAGMLALTYWLWRCDLARRTVRQRGQPRFIAIALLSGYAWLGVAGVLNLTAGGVVVGPRYDAGLHALGLGFVFAMIIGHAPVIFPALWGRPIPYRPLLYLPLLGLHASLLVRVVGDLGDWLPGRLWGGLLNAGAIVLFFGMLIYLLLSARVLSPRSWRGDR